MAAVRMKPQYGPTLGQLLSPHWHAASAMARRAMIAAGAGLLAVVISVTLTLVNPTFSRGGTVPFSFSYRGLYRVTPSAGSYVKVQRRGADGRLEGSFAVGPLRLPAYAGELSGELPLYATGYISGLARRHQGFVLRGEGKTKVNTVPAYTVSYSTVLEGRVMWGRDVLLLPERAGAREGVDIMMLMDPATEPEISSPSEVATKGPLERPLETFTLG
jgi:hypothetical protein